LIQENKNSDDDSGDDNELRFEEWSESKEWEEYYESKSRKWRNQTYDD